MNTGHLTNSTKLIRVKNAVAAGQTAIESDIIDMAGFVGVRFFTVWGAITSGGVQSQKVQQDHVNGTSGMADLAGSSLAVADDYDNKITISDIYRPTKQFVRCVVSRATQDSAVDAIIAELYDANNMPVAKHATVAAQELLVSPDEGTA